MNVTLRRHFGGFLIACLIACAGVLLAAFARPTAASAELPAGLIDELRATLAAGMAEAMEEGLISGGSAIVVTVDQVLLREGYGMAELATGEAFSPDSAVVLASVTKPIVATATARAVSLGLVSFEDRIDSYLPAFAAVPLSTGGDPLPAPTIAQLLSHTGGMLGNEGRDAWLQALGERTQAEGETPPEEVNAAVVAALAEDGYSYAPGTEFRYSGLGFNIVALILQQVTKTDDYETAMDVLLFDPLGRDTLTFRPDAPLVARMPMRYNIRPGGLRPAGRINPRPRFGYVNAGGSLVGTPDDLAAIVRLHLNRGKLDGESFIDESVLEAMYVAQPNARDRGIGFRVGAVGEDGTGAYMRHGGASGTQLWFDLDTGIGGAILTQTPARQTRGLALRLQIDLLNLARQAMGFEPVESADASEAAN